MKNTLTFAEFSAAVAEAGYLPTSQTDKIFVVKPNTKGAGKIEINLSSGTFYVGAGSRHVDAQVEAARAAGFTLLKRAKGWGIFDAPSDTAALMERFIELVGVAVRAVPGSAPAKTKNPSRKPTIAQKIMKTVEKVSKPLSAEQIMRAAEIKAKNLATMKAVTAKINAEKAA